MPVLGTCSIPASRFRSTEVLRLVEQGRVSLKTVLQESSKGKAQQPVPCCTMLYVTQLYMVVPQSFCPLISVKLVGVKGITRSDSFFGFRLTRTIWSTAGVFFLGASTINQLRFATLLRIEHLLLKWQWTIRWNWQLPVAHSPYVDRKILFFFATQF